MPTTFRDPSTGQVVEYANISPEQEARLVARGLRRAIPEEIEAAEQYQKHSTALEQMKAAAELGVASATFGALASDSPEAQARRGAFRQESPILSTAVEQVGAAIPAAAAGALTGGAGLGLGLSSQAAGRLAFAAESVAMGTAIEAEQAREERRGIDLSNVLTGLALDVATAGASRAARAGVARLTRGASDVAGAAATTIDELADSPSTVVARANRVSRERRSVGAAGVDTHGGPKRRPHERPEIEDYARNHETFKADVDELAYDAINTTIGGDAPAFDAVHNISLKRGDIAGRMQDADVESVLDFVMTQSERAEELAVKLQADGAQTAANTIRNHIQRLTDTLEADSFVEDAAIELDQLKRTADRMRSKFGATATKASDPLRERVQWLDELLDPSDTPLRKGLEDRKTWGKLWADKQLEENRLWSGSDGSPLSGLINTGKVWQRAFAEPHANIKVRRGLDEVPVFRSKGELHKVALNMSEPEFRETMNAFDTWIDKASQMNAIKSELAVQSIEKTPVVQLQSALDRMKLLSEELKSLRELEHASEPIRKHLASLETGKGTAQAIYEAAKKVPLAGQALEAAERVPGVREKIYEMFAPDPAKPIERNIGDAAADAVRARQARRATGWMSEKAQTPKERAEAFLRDRRNKPVPPHARPDVTVGGPEAGFATPGALAAGTAVAGGALAAPLFLDSEDTHMTDALAELSDHSRALTDRAALGFVAPATRAPALPAVIERFKGDSADIRSAFTENVQRLLDAHQDTANFVEAMTEAFSDIGIGGHTDLYERIVARTQVATQYLLRNMPPALAASMTNPEGVPPDPLAIAEFAKLWSGAFRPGDVVYDVGVGRATPSQIRALREVHPDIYQNLRVAVIRSLGETRTVPFETKRQLDVLFQLDGAAGPSFSSAFQTTMATARANKTKQSQSLSGESVLAPQSPNKIFSSGPSAIR